MRLLLLDNALDHGYYRPREHWARLCPPGVELLAVHVAGGEPLPEPGRHSHVIVSGSEASITERAAWAEREAAWLRRAAARGARLLGSCWGHQLLAVAFWGPQAVRRAAQPEFGWLPITTADADNLLPPGTWHCFFAHFDEVTPGCHPDLRVLATSPGCAVAAMRVGELPVWGLQPHPEVDPETGRSFLQGAAARWPEHRELFERALAEPVRDDDAGATLLERFLQL